MSFKKINERLKRAQKEKLKVAKNISAKERRDVERKKLVDKRNKRHKFRTSLIKEYKLLPIEVIALMYIMAENGDKIDTSGMALAFYGNRENEETEEEIKECKRKLRRMLAKLKKKELIYFEKKQEQLQITYEFEYKEGLFIEFDSKQIIKTSNHLGSLILIYLGGWKKENKEWVKVANLKMSRDLGVGMTTIKKAMKKLDDSLQLTRSTHFKTRYIFID